MVDHQYLKIISLVSLTSFSFINLHSVLPKCSQWGCPRHLKVIKSVLNINMIFGMWCLKISCHYSSRSVKILTIYLDPTHLLFWIGSRHLTRLFFPPHTSYEGTNPGLHKHTTFPDRWNICQIMAYKYQVKLRFVCIFQNLW